MIGIENKIPSSAADWLSLAATPVFAVMALVTQVLAADSSPILCSMPHGASPMTGMVPMYALMSVFHVSPWLKLIGKRRLRNVCPEREPSGLRA